MTALEIAADARYADTMLKEAELAARIDANAAEARAEEREAFRKLVEEIRSNPWHRSALAQSAERETCDRILAEVERRTGATP